MTMTDPIADFLTRIRNGISARKHEVTCPSNGLKVELARVLKEEGFLGDYGLSKDGAANTLTLKLKYSKDGKSVIHGIDRISKPGRRVYRGKDELENYRNGFGIFILNTPQGVMSDRSARKTGVGGELLCSVW